MTRGAVRPALLLAAGVLALSCGRTNLDWTGPDNTPLATGAAGTVASTGAAGTVASTGAAGTRATGAAGTVGQTGAAGTRATGAAGTVGPTGAAGTRATGAAGTVGSTGAAGGPGMPRPIPCGTSFCLPGAQTCCLSFQGGQPSQACIPAGAMCEGGATLGCIDTPSCGAGAVCCVSTQTLSTTCSRPAACVIQPGLILCGADADCPVLLPHCCGSGNFKVCLAQPCGGGGGGGNGRPGRGGPGAPGAP